MNNQTKRKNLSMEILIEFRELQIKCRLRMNDSINLIYHSKDKLGIHASVSNY